MSESSAGKLCSFFDLTLTTGSLHSGQEGVVTDLHGVDVQNPL